MERKSVLVVYLEGKKRFVHYPEFMSVVADGPVKKIACEDDIEPWTRSIAYWRITRHIAALAEAIAGHSLTEEVERDDVG